MNELEDIKLQALLQEMKLDAPNPKFSLKVMTKIFEQSNALEEIKAQRILGKGFWIISTLFIALLVVVFVSYNSGLQPESQFQDILPNLNAGATESYQSFFSKIGTVPLSIAGILIASSVLLFIDRIISSNSKLFA